MHHYRDLLHLQKEELQTKSQSRRREKLLRPAAAAFAKVNDEHQKPQMRGKKENINRWLTSAEEVKSLGLNARHASIWMNMRAEYGTGLLDYYLRGNNWDQRYQRNGLEQSHTYTQPHYPEPHSSLVTLVSFSSPPVFALFVSNAPRANFQPFLFCA